MMRRQFPWLLCLLAVLLTALPLPLQAAAPALRAGQQTRPTEPTPTPTRPPMKPLTAEEMLAQMSVAEKVGELFIISFEGQDIASDSEIATLVRDYRIGGVVLLPENDNYRNTPIRAPGTNDALRSTPLQIATLAATLQGLAASQPRPINAPAAITTTTPLSETTGITTTATVTATATLMPSPTLTPTVFITPTVAGLRLPLLVALDWTGDDSSFLSGRGGFTPLPSSMALGATWSPQLAEQVGEIMGQELRTAGVNLILGPSLDVLDVPRPGAKGDMDTRSFGGDPFWVGQIGQAFIRGVATGSTGNVATAAKHFPGQGGSDRTPEDEVATVQKSVQQLRQIELAPFAAVANANDMNAPGITAALMTSHIRYRGFQGNIRELTPPISLAPQLQDLMALDEFAAWRAAGGVLISDALGVPAIRRYYDPTLTRFPHRQVAQDAFLAGNDLLYLHRFALTDDWTDQVAAIKETLLFFQDKYQTDAAFAARVDASVDRIIRMKLRLFGPTLQLPVTEDLRIAPNAVGQSTSVTRSVARSSLTLIYPGREEFADRMPTAPLENEKILIFTDARMQAECATCGSEPIIAPDALERIIRQLYGPEATGQIKPANVLSLTFMDLYNLLNRPQGQAAEIESAIASSNWIIFAQLDLQPTEHPESVALRSFLARRSDSLRDKRLVVLGLRAPYYLDTTEISKLTAYFGVYGTTAPFLESAVRAVFREFSPVGAPPVTVSGINYELINQLEPAPGQVIALNPIGAGDVITGSIQVGSQIELETGIIRDRKGHAVPDGTLVEFYLRYPTESLALAPKVETTSGGKARTIVPLDRPGELWITAQSGEARNSTRIELRVGGDSPGSIATVIPTPTPSPTATPTITPSPTATATFTPQPTQTSQPPPDPIPPTPRVALPAYFAGLVGVAGAGGIAFTARKRNGRKTKSANVEAVAAALWAAVAAWCAYLLYAVGWLPGSTDLQTKGYAWAAGVVTLAGGLLSMLWTMRTKKRAPE